MEVDLMHDFTNTPKTTDFVLPGLVAGTVGLLTSPGGTGKSLWITQAALCVVSDAANASLLNLPIINHGPVVVLNVEDPKDMIHSRIHQMGAFLDEKTRASLVNSTSIQSLYGSGFNILNEVDQVWLLDLLIKKNARLCVIDTLSRCHTVDENSNAEMSKVTTTLERIARDSGTAIVIVHHTSKFMAAQGRTDEQQSARGASSLVDNARWQAYMSVMTEAEAKKEKIKADDRKYYVRFGISKQNYGQPFADHWYKRHEGGVLLPIVAAEVL
jgi:hypothetical protein